MPRGGGGGVVGKIGSYDIFNSEKRGQGQFSINREL